MRKALNIFLLMGQSNMAGRGKLDQVPELVHREVHMFRAGVWVPAMEPLHTDKPRIAGIGLGMSFATTVLGAANMAPIGLVPCAVGGTPLSRWMPGCDLYEATLTTARTALTHGELRGVLWHQGEGDSNSRDDASTYGDRFRNMIQNLRADLATRSVPVIAGELAPFLQAHSECEFYALVNAQLKALEGRVPAYACVSAEGMRDNGDSLHFNAVSLREFGTRYARRFLDMTGRDDLEQQNQKDDRVSDAFPE